MTDEQILQMIAGILSGGDFIVPLLKAALLSVILYTMGKPLYHLRRRSNGGTDNDKIIERLESLGRKQDRTNDQLSAMNTHIGRVADQGTTNAEVLKTLTRAIEENTKLGSKVVEMVLERKPSA